MRQSDSHAASILDAAVIQVARRDVFYWLAILSTFALATNVGVLIIKIFTRPLGASFGYLLSQPFEYGGMGFGTLATSLGFLSVVALTVAALNVVRPSRV